jgi:hypothetical protein
MIFLTGSLISFWWWLVGLPVRGVGCFARLNELPPGYRARRALPAWRAVQAEVRLFRTCL